MPRTLPRALSTAAKATVTVLLLALLFRKINYTSTLHHLAEIKPFTACGGLTILFFGLLAATARWRIVLRSIGRLLDTWRLFRINLIGQFFNQALPSTIGGDGMRVWLLYRRGCSFAEAFNSVLIDRIAGFVVLAIMSLYGLPTLAERIFAIPKVQVIAGVAVVIVVTLILLYLLARLRKRLAKFRAGRFVAQIVADALFLTARPGAAAKIAALSIVAQLSGFLVVWLILRDLGADVSVVGVMIVAPVVFLLLVLPISIAGWGLREGLFVLGFGLLNVREEIALAASIVFGLISLVVGLIGGVFWLLESSHSRNSVMEPSPSFDTSPFGRQSTGDKRSSFQSSSS